ncbi:flagellar export protein FliJ [Alkalimarinus sediminis]|uniref:Flagellar FliJ protein n=1 Tax=Alkalimarinus sediminis TaxID=1632866 RepID=A0A9E8HPJ5_9ALTE|nr:flagellar export protein FliJ [Alkalimarinus sediminis]UZW76756.1 flagellar export protein FliJ [Alkalimarinus sediminis]
MRRSKRLQVVLELAKRKEDEALKAMQASQQNLRMQHDKLQELIRYQQEYQQALRDAFSTGATAANCATYQHFLSQVGGAIEQQQQVVSLAEEQLNKAKEHWQTLYEKQKGMGGLIDRFRDEEDLEIEKKEQKMIDELSQRKRT